MLFHTSTHNQTRSKYGPTLKKGYVVLPVITSRPLRLPYVRRSPLAGFIRLEEYLLQQEYCRDAGISGSTSLSFSACRWPYSGFPVGACTLYFPTSIGLLSYRTRSAYSPDRRPGLSLYHTLPAISVWRKLTKLHHSLYATACGFG